MSAPVSSSVHSKRGLCPGYAIVAIGISSTLCVSCSENHLPAPGQVLILLSSDMQVPSGINEVIITVGEAKSQQRYVFLPPDAPDSSSAELLRKLKTAEPKCQTRSTDNNGKGPSYTLSLPNTFGITSKYKDARATSLEVTACKDGRVVYDRSNRVEVPKEGMPSRLLRFSLPWICADKGRNHPIPCFGCNTSPCYRRAIEDTDATNALCVASACPARESESLAKTVVYDSEETARYAAAAEESSGCFDVLGCFDLGEGLDALGGRTEQLAVDWQTNPRDDISRDFPCIASLSSSYSVTTLEKYNLALVLPPNTQGSCTDAYCLVPLLADSPLGWSVATTQTSSVLQSEITLPSAVCRMLDSGQALAVIGSTQCAAMTEAYPVCEVKPTDAKPSPSDKSPEATTEQKQILRFRLDEGDSEPILPETSLGSNPFQLQRVIASDDTGSRAVSGVAGFGQSLDSHNYLRSNGPPPAYGENFSAIVWASLTERAFDELDPNGAITVASNTHVNCRDGFRITLERCSDGRVLVGVSRPIGTAYRSSTRCNFETTYSVFATESWEGGYYTPWRRGNYRQIAVTVSASRPDEPTIYLDGEAVESLPEGCVAETREAVFNDESLLYLGSSKHLSTPDTTTRGPVEVDEFSLYDRTLTDTQVRQIYRDTLTQAGPSLRRWGAFANQGSSATLESSTPAQVVATLEDAPYATAGLFTLLNGSQSIVSNLATKPKDLSSYDEAVLWADVPTSKPFQFVLSSAQGRRSCTWQLEANEGKKYVINLREPSSCSDPLCYFDLQSIERAYISSDYAGGDAAPFSLGVEALAFRKRKLGSTVTASSSHLGISSGENNFCWRAVSDAPQWFAQVTPVSPEARTQNDSIKTFGRWLRFDIVASGSNQSPYPKLTLDFPAAKTDSASSASAPIAKSRNFLCCDQIQACISSDSKTGSLLPNEMALIFGNQKGQTYRVIAKSDDSGCYLASLRDVPNTQDDRAFGTERGAPLPNNACSVLEDTVRIALESNRGFTLSSLSCCDSFASNCALLSSDDPTTTCSVEAVESCGDPSKNP